LYIHGFTLHKASISQTVRLSLFFFLLFLLLVLIAVLVLLRLFLAYLFFLVRSRCISTATT
jgi:hypothetical protein